MSAKLRRAVVGAAAASASAFASATRASPSAPTSVSAPGRRAALREILSQQTAATQDELLRALAARGIVSAQATISRDLGRLGATRVNRPDGARYSLPEGDRTLPLDVLQGLVDTVSTNGYLVVVRTKAGAASTVARAIDDARFRDALGSIAGDDTVFVAATQQRRTTDLATQVRRLFR